MEFLKETPKNDVSQENMTNKKDEQNPDVKNIWIQNENNELINKSVDFEKKLAMDYEKIETQKEVIVPYRKNQMRATSNIKSNTALSLNFAK